jgi:hypothetical protein
MSVIDDPRTKGLIERVRFILTKPKEAFEIIDGETPTTQELYLGYACILAALSAVALLVVRIVFSGFFFAPVWALSSAVFGYLMNLAMPFVMALIADALAPSFGGQKSQIQALKASIYGCTAGWVGGACLIVPILGGLGALAGGLYSLYLLYLALPKLMKVPEDKAAGYFVVVLLATLIVGGVLASLAFPFHMGRMFYGY